jgi:tetratricopeptide (TPR) repeat protein
MAQREAGQLDASLESLKRTATAVPESVAAHYQLGLTYLAQAKYDEAQGALEIAHRLLPQAAEVQAALGGALLLGGKPEEAFAAFATLTRRQNAHLSDFVALATAYQAAGRAADAERTYRDAADRFPQDPEAWWRLGAILAFSRKYDEASKALASGIAIAPKDPRLLRDAAIAEARLGNYPAATALADRLLESDPKSAEARFLVAGLYQDSGDKSRAVELYRAILADKPDYPWALNNLAALLTESGDAASAIPLAKHAAELRPDDAAIADTLGWSLLKSGQMRASVQMLDKARALAPSDPEILYRLAVAQKAAGDVGAARTSAREALALSSDFKDVEEAKALLAGLPSEPSLSSGKSP